MNKHMLEYQNKKIKEVCAKVSPILQEFVESDPILSKLSSHEKTEFVVDFLVLMICSVAGLAIDKKSFAIEISERIMSQILMNEHNGSYQKAVDQIKAFQEFKKDQKME